MTLVEVVFALAISGLAIAGIVSGYIFSVDSAQRSALSLAASGRALERLEQTRAATWEISSFPPIDQLQSSNFPIEVVTLDLPWAGSTVTSATNITQISQIATNPPLRRIHVDCVWSYNGNQLLTNSIETCRAPDQ
jgi:type II secretory pathway pseudopilin PulG